MSSKYIKKHEIPKGYEELLSEFTKEILRNQPQDIIDFGVEYFKCLQERLVLDYEHKGQNLPCDFKPAIPKIPENLKFYKKGELEVGEVNILTGEREKLIGDLQKADKEEKIKPKSESASPKEETTVKIDGNEPLKEGEQIQGEEKISDQKIEESNIRTVVKTTVVTKTEIRISSNNGEEGGGNVEEEVGEEKEVVNKESINSQERQQEPEDKSPSNNQSDVPVQNQQGSEANKKQNSDPQNYENCIDFPEKEVVLSKLTGEFPEETGTYIKDVFEPNKGLNDLICEMQGAIGDFYAWKGTEKEEGFKAKYEGLKNKLSEINSELNCPLLDIEFNSKNAQENIAEFKKYDYYPSITKAFLYKIEEMHNNTNLENDELSNEMNYFVFINQLKKILEQEKPLELIKEKPYIKSYFDHNIQLLSPEIYSFIKGLPNRQNSEICDIFTNFEVRTRELCVKYCELYYLDNKDKSIKKKINLMNKLMFVSSPKQLLEILLSANGENNDMIYDTVSEKLMLNFQHLWTFIQRVVNTPNELIKSAYNAFRQFDYTEREVIMNLLALNNDYQYIQSKLSTVEIDPMESNFNNLMKELLFGYVNVPELNERNNCIFRNKLFDVPKSCQEFLSFFEEGNDVVVDEEKLLDDYRKMNFTVQNGIYNYLRIKDREVNNLSSFLQKLNSERNKTLAEEYKIQTDILKNNFTLDSDEFEAFKKEYNEWKKTLSPEILSYFSAENDTEKEEIFKKLPDFPDKVTLYYVMKTENNLDEQRPYDSVVEKYKAMIPEGSVKQTIEEDELLSNHLTIQSQSNNVSRIQRKSETIDRSNDNRQQNETVREEEGKAEEGTERKDEGKVNESEGEVNNQIPQQEDQIQHQKPQKQRKKRYRKGPDGELETDTDHGFSEEDGEILSGNVEEEGKNVAEGE